MDSDIYTEPLPKRDKEGYLHFPDYPDFCPNLTPKEVLHRGSFGGTYFRDINSSVLGKRLRGRDAIAELPKEWFEGLNLKYLACSQVYDPSVNKYSAAPERHCSAPGAPAARRGSCQFGRGGR